MPNDSEQLTGCKEGRRTKISLATVYAFMSLFGTTLNILVIYLVVSFKKLRTTSNAFIVNGCVADLLVCAFWMPHEVVLISTGTPFVAVYRAFKDTFVFIGITVSLLSHSLIAVNRYILITKVPATYVSLYQKRNTEWMISASWVISLGCVLPWLTTAQHPSERCSGLQVVSASFASRISGLSNPIASGTIALTIFVQTAIVLYCYFKIFRRVQTSMKRVSILNFQIVNNLPYAFPRKDKRLGAYVLAVCCIYLLTTEPLLWVLSMGLFRTVPMAVRTTSWIFFCALFVLNPFLYTWKNEEFRKSFKSVVRGEFCRGSTVGVEPVMVNTISHLLQRQSSRRAFTEELN